MEEKQKLTDQWKTYGHCKECRRYSYCKKQCRANREAILSIARKRFMKATGMDKAMAAINELKGE